MAPSDGMTNALVVVQVDSMWRELMESALVTPSVLLLASDRERLATLEENNKLLDDIQKV